MKHTNCTKQETNGWKWNHDELVIGNTVQEEDIEMPRRQSGRQHVAEDVADL
jgi:hypothetical protein